MNGCTCDLEEGMAPDRCVFDGPQPVSDCGIAMRMMREGKGRDDCEFWKPVNVSGMDDAAKGEG